MRITEKSLREALIYFHSQRASGGDAGLAPLLQFFNNENIKQQSCPSVNYMNGVDLPSPFDFLLTQQLMTLGIAKYYRRTPKVRAPLYTLYDSKQQIYERAIFMIVDNHEARDDALAADKVGEATIVELGLISMNFAALPSHVIEGVLHGQLPFGTLLASNQIKTHNINTQYFTINCSAALNIYLNCSRNPVFYGRINTLIGDDNNQWIAHVFEILTDNKLT